jgi:hypothetical protein
LEKRLILLEQKQAREAEEAKNKALQASELGTKSALVDEKATVQVDPVMTLQS